jgi:hypothetical protein
MSPLTAPSKIQVNVAPTVFSDPDITFNDLSERLFVYNLSKREIVWRYAKQEWVLPIQGKHAVVPLEVCIVYLGDPRSAWGVTNQFTVPGQNRPGVVPERYNELRRLAVHYGIYEGLLTKINTVKFRDIPRDRNDPERNLYPNENPNDTIVPKIKVTTLDGQEIRFPIYEPEASPYRYDTEVTGMTDVRTELEKLQRQQQMNADRIEALLRDKEEGDGDIPGATEDSVQPPLG